MKTIALYNMKGGVGKTSSAVNLAYVSAEEGHRTLLCDLDPQGSASFYFRVTAPKKMSAKHLVKGDDRFLSSIKATNYENLDILPADFSYRNLSTLLHEKKRSKKRIKETIGKVKDDYDIVILDTQPALNLEAENVFTAADMVLVPIIPSTLSIQTLQLIRKYFAKHGLDLRNVWVFFSLVDRRKKLHLQTMEELAGRESNILESAIPYSSSVEKMGITREPLLVHGIKTQAAAAYLGLWRELHRLLFPGEKPVHFIP